MTTLSTPIDKTLERFVDEMISSKKAENKTQVVRRALYQMREDEALKDLIEARADVAQGKVYKGNLRKLSDAL
ncbi:MAG: hypothetical protein JKX80_00310 [Candidatus Pacebacteria bacterium]|nr:hypothetical protein [Candidatus Paceibacterota bacterium]